MSRKCEKERASYSLPTFFLLKARQRNDVSTEIVPCHEGLDRRPAAAALSPLWGVPVRVESWWRGQRPTGKTQCAPSVQGARTSLAGKDGAHVAELKSTEAADGPTAHCPSSPLLLEQTRT